uniref:Bm4163, isoform a n=1 Tax=Brugia malayi TaxID=6279 RepID=A0A1I9FZS4_BRUMA|nr:Bm4163, isoform a [Brugia malayi]
MNFTYKLYKLNLILTKNNSVAKKIKKIFLVSLNDIIQGALNFVRPIIDTSGSMQSDLMISRKLQSETIRGRDAEILGSPKYSSTLDDMPICRSNSRICKFITCSAHNFQNDESLSNLNLAAQMLADTRLRKMIASNPSILLTVCQEHGLSSVQCKLFANAFQLINRYFNNFFFKEYFISCI